ncbi:pilus assembly protein PilS [Neisseria gonorrhoeae]
MSSFPCRREFKLVRTETYRAKRFLQFYVLDSRLRGNDGFRDCGVVGRVSRLRCCRE